MGMNSGQPRNKSVFATQPRLVHALDEWFWYGRSATAATEIKKNIFFYVVVVEGTLHSWLCNMTLLRRGEANFAAVQLCRMNLMCCCKASFAAALCGRAC